MTAFLLCKNKYGFTQIGDMTYITINEHLQSYLPETKENDLLMVKQNNKDINVGDKIYYYAVENNEYVIKTAHVKEIVISEDDMALYQLDDEAKTTIATTRVIGKYSAIYHNIGGVLDVLQSRIGFLLLVILPILLIFMYQIYALIIVIKYGEEELEEITLTEEESDGFNQTNSFIFSGNGCFLYSGRAIYPSTSFKTLYFKEKRYLEMEEEFC